ncbi:MAG: hypothetical protein NUV91_04665, partial [Candidatus Omnitrophica bacterium]|nr:hypothetical protein [Candidatus Omnitrophota bacterium]
MKILSWCKMFFLLIASMAFIGSSSSFADSGPKSSDFPSTDVEETVSYSAMTPSEDVDIAGVSLESTNPQVEVEKKESIIETTAKVRWIPSSDVEHMDGEVGMTESTVGFLYKHKIAEKLP